jgi:hypothetical protein
VVRCIIALLSLLRFVAATSGSSGSPEPAGEALDFRPMSSDQSINQSSSVNFPLTFLASDELCAWRFSGGGEMVDLI